MCLVCSLCLVCSAPSAAESSEEWVGAIRATAIFDSIIHRSFLKDLLKKTSGALKLLN